MGHREEGEGEHAGYDIDLYNSCLSRPISAELPRHTIHHSAPAVKSRVVV